MRKPNTFTVVLVAAALAADATGQTDVGPGLRVKTDTIVGEARGDQFGWTVAPGGDVNRDGVPDLLVGAPSAFNPENQQYAGRCYLFHGPIDGPRRAGDADAVFFGEEFGDHLYIATSIDANNDGYCDVMLGAPGHDQPVRGAGRVYIFHGPVSGALSVSRADATISGVNDFDGVGARLAVGDLNGDGVDDAILGCPGASVNGRLFIMYGPLPRRGSVADADAVVTAALPFENLGVSIAAADVNGDGLDDLLIGAPAAPINQTPPGRVYVFFGPVAAALSASDADLIIEGEGANDRLGSSVATGDFNGDGAEDLLMGADQFYYTPGAGKTYIFHGPVQRGFRNARTADAVLIGELSRDQFGFAATSAGDVNADGFDDVVIGAPGFGVGDAGRAYFFLGPLNGVIQAADADLTLDGSPLDWIGYSVAGVGDIDGNGIDDAVLGGPAHPSAESAGRVIVVRPLPRDGPQLRLSGDCPGLITIEWSNATPDATMGIVFARESGRVVIPSGPCRGTMLGLGANQLHLIATANTGSQGQGEASGNAGIDACNGLLQLVVADGSPCATSNVRTIP